MSLTCDVVENGELIMISCCNCLSIYIYTMEPLPPAPARPPPPASCGRVTLRGGLCKRPLTSCTAKHHLFQLKMQDIAHYAVYRKAVATYKLQNETCDPTLANVIWSAWHGTSHNHDESSSAGVFTSVYKCKNYDIVEVPRAIHVHDEKISVKHRSLFPQWALVAVKPLCIRPRTKHAKPRHDDIDHCGGETHFDILESDGHCFELPPPRRERTKTSASQHR